jgi:hypothetical protein
MEDMINTVYICRVLEIKDKAKGELKAQTLNVTKD